MRALIGALCFACLAVGAHAESTSNSYQIRLDTFQKQTLLLRMDLLKYAASVLASGDMSSISCSNELMAYARSTEPHSVLVLAKLAEEMDGPSDRAKVASALRGEAMLLKGQIRSAGARFLASEAICKDNQTWLYKRVEVERLANEAMSLLDDVP